jgi:membrane-associated phospholipid phosphatase
LDLKRTTNINKQKFSTHLKKQIIFLFSIIGFIQHTNCQSLQTDSLIDTKPLHFSYHQLYIPSSLILAGIIINGKSPNAINNKVVRYRNEHMPKFHTHWDNYLQFSPIVLTYGFEALGMKPKTDILNRSVILLKSELVMFTAVQLLKRSSHTLRPDGSDYYSFPSGHTAQAFAGAAILSEEYGYRYKWVPYLSYGLASGVGVIRMANNKHYLSDVLVAAGVGVLSSKLAYWTHQYKWGKQRHPKPFL